MQRWVGLAVVGAGLCLSGIAGAAEPDRSAERDRLATATGGQENFGMGATLGFFNPSGLALRGGVREASLEVTAGFMPSLLSYGSSRDPQLKLIAPFEITPQLLFELLQFKHGGRAGLRMGYRYNWVLGHGGSLGGHIGKRIGRLLIEGVWGLTAYPGAADRLLGDRVPEGSKFNFPPWLNWGLNVSLFYYP